jgi:hypothetical protein
MTSFCPQLLPVHCSRPSQIQRHPAPSKPPSKEGLHCFGFLLFLASLLVGTDAALEAEEADFFNFFSLFLKKYSHINP